jgi:hypothetical protein
MPGRDWAVKGHLSLCDKGLGIRDWGLGFKLHGLSSRLGCKAHLSLCGIDSMYIYIIYLIRIHIHIHMHTHLHLHIHNHMYDA